jgi:hypothetical protein
LTANNRIAIRINAVDLKNRLRDIETDGRNRSLRNWDIGRLVSSGCSKLSPMQMTPGSPK